MAGKERMRLTDGAVAKLRSREREYTVWDRRVAGLGVRVRPTGARTWVILEETAEGRTRRISLGPVSTMGVAEARLACHARRAIGEPERTVPEKPPAPPFRELVEGEWRAAHFERYKPSTQTATRLLLKSRILPAFGTTPLDGIAPADVGRWFDDYSRTAPGGANRALEILHQILNFAIARGHIETNPARGVKRNRRPALTRFLSRDEIARLHRALDAKTGTGERQQADIVRLLLLTGCRLGEIVGLRRSEVRGDTLMLEASKTGPRKVPLNGRARAILERQPAGEGPFVFPSPFDPARPRCTQLRVWYRVRKEAGIEDVRLHDLRHTHASHAVMNGVPVPVVARMLGHSNVRMTLRYAHLGDRDIERAAERIGRSIADLMGEP